MSVSIEQIILFNALKLQPKSGKEVELWKKEIEKKLIKLHKIEDCYVKIHQIIIEKQLNQKRLIEIESGKLSNGRVTRIRKIKHCCKFF